MKQLFSLLLAALMCAMSAEACVKKHSTAESPARELVGFVMDTTQALLPGVQVSIGKVTLTTSYDGRFVFKAAQWKHGDKLTFSCKGYEEQKMQLKDSVGAEPLIVRLIRKRGKETDADGAVAYGSSSKHAGAMLYSRTTVMAADVADGMAEPYIYEEAAEAEGDVAELTKTEMTGHVPSAANNAVSAGKLTAGEVNDFAKWYFWPSILDNSHKQYISHWQIIPRHRYTAQVVNADGRPVSGRAVSLLDTNGNTLFQAVTDNTGKAELWYRLIDNGLCGKHAGLRIRVDDRVIDAHDWSEGLNIIRLDEPCEQTEEVDVMFVFDATGSMGDELHYLQAEMKDVIARAKEATGGLDIRTGAVVYRDHGDEYVTRISRLTDDITVTQAFIDKQYASGGGDYPEAVPEALMAALNAAGWNSEARARIAFLILDAPCHQDSATVALLHEQVLNAAALGVRVVPVVCSGIGESGELLMRAIALATNGTSFFLTDDSGIGHTHLKPTTDSLRVEHLNDMLVRTVVEFSTMPDCETVQEQEEMTQEELFVPNPFEQKDIESGNVTLPHGEGIHYIVDVSGKLITIYEGDVAAIDAHLTTLQLPVGVYFVKTYAEGQWSTRKILVRN